jgi:hypothetical protein
MRNHIYLAMVAIVLSGCGSATAVHDSAGPPPQIHLSPAERLATLEAHGETPTPSLVEGAERMLRRLSTECNQDTETIVMNIEVSIGFIHDEIGLRESAMDMADAVDAAASAFHDRDCVKAMRAIAAGEVMSAKN